METKYKYSAGDLVVFPDFKQWECRKKEWDIKYDGFSGTYSPGRFPESIKIATIKSHMKEGHHTSSNSGPCYIIEENSVYFYREYELIKFVSKAEKLDLI